MNKFLTFVGFIIVSLSLFFVMAALGEIVKGSKTSFGVLAGILVFFLITTAGGIYLIKNNILKEKKTWSQKREKEIIELAKSKEGMITVAEVASETNMDFEDSKKVLDELCNKGFSDIKISEKGSIVYVFKGFLSKEEKLRAKEPL